jgi:hypothetical protein
MNVLIMQFSPISCYFLFFRFTYSPAHPVLKYCSNVLHSHNTTAKIVLMNALIFKVLDRSGGDKRC